MRRILALAAALTLGSAGGSAEPLGPFALTNLSEALLRAYNDQDGTALHGLLGPALKARYSPEALRTVLTRCRVLTGDLLRLSTPTWGARHYGFFAAYAESGVFEMILEIDEGETIVHWVLTDDLAAKEQQCALPKS